MGYMNVSMSNHGIDVDVYWDAPYGSDSAYVYWTVNENTYGNRTFNLVYRSDTSKRYNSGSNVPFGQYTLYVYKNGSYATQSDWMDIYEEDPPTHFYWYFAGDHGSDPNPNYQMWTEGSTATLMSALPNVAGTTYTVSYNANGGSSTPNSSSSTCTYKHTYWNDDYGDNYSPGAKIYNVTEGNSFRAVWSETRTSVTLASAISRSQGTATRTVTFNANGGSCSTASLNSTAKITYTFGGWKANNAGTALSAGSSYKPSSDVTMYASWSSSTGSYSAITLPTPTRTGYDFKGWSTSSTATSGSTGSYTPTGDVTLYATWAKKTYTVSYNANGHGTAPSSQTKTYGTNLTLRSFISQQTGTGYTVSFNKNGGSSTPSSLTSTLTYDQTYWNTNSSGTGTNYSSGGTYSTEAAATLYAIWKTTNGAVTLPSAISHASSTEDGYTITFNANGGSCSTTSLTATNTRSYTFSKWAAGSTSGTKYSAGASFTPTGTTTMYATWTESVSNGSITLPTPTRTGYTFKGWATSSSATSGTAAGATYTPTSTTTLYATWQANTWTVQYNANGYGTAPSSQTKTYGQTLTLRSFIADQTVTGYTVSFNKNGGTSTPSSLTSNITKKQTYWNTNSSGTGTNYSSGGNYTTNGAATLYAIWGTTTNGSVTLPAALTADPLPMTGYTVTFNANGGTCATTSLTSTKTDYLTFDKWAVGSVSGTKYSAGASFTPTADTTMWATWTEQIVNGSIDLPTASKSGYTFVGWSTSSTATSGVTGSYTPTSNVTLYAVYSANGYAVTYNANGHGTAPANQTKTHGTALTLQSFIADQTEDGYTVTFNPNGGSISQTSMTSKIKYKQTYWNTNSSGTGTNYGSKASYTTDSALSLYAIWESTPIAIVLPTPTRDGYTFKGWSSNQSSTSGLTGQLIPTSNLTLYAIWGQSNSIVQYNNAGTVVPCNVYYNNNGTPILCEVYYNNNGTAVKI